MRIAGGRARWMARILWGGVALGSVLAWLGGSRILHLWGLLALLTAYAPLGLAWTRSKGLAIRPGVVWAIIAVTLGGLGQVVAGSEPVASGRPFTGHFSYLSGLATLAALITVLGARKPGSGAWAILMGMLVLVFLLPWLEGAGLVGRSRGMDRLRLEAPWSIFYAGLAVAGIVNYLPTRWGFSAMLVGGSLAVEWLALALNWPLPRRSAAWSVSAAVLGLGISSMFLQGRREVSPPGLASLWFWFRDRWGVVWALRVKERFNRTAEASSWQVRITWQGPSPCRDATESAEAEAVLASLLRRFADPDRISEARRGSSG